MKKTIAKFFAALVLLLALTRRRAYDHGSVTTLR